MLDVSHRLSYDHAFLSGVLMRDWWSAGLYFLMKVVVIAERASTVWTAVKAVLKREAAFGQYATEEEIMEGGNTCAICQASGSCWDSPDCGNAQVWSCLSFGSVLVVITRYIFVLLC